MRAKLSVLLGRPPDPRHNPEMAAESGDLGDLLVESSTLAWLLNPRYFPVLTRHGDVECMIERRLFSLFEPAGANFVTDLSAAETSELQSLGRTLMGRLQYTAAAAGVFDLDRHFFTRLYWVCHADSRALLKFLTCRQDPVRSRLLNPLSPTQSLLDAPSATRLRQACEADTECGVVLGQLASVFDHCERYGPEATTVLLQRVGLDMRPVSNGAWEVALPPNANPDDLLYALK